jgi:hypothetical protein
MENGKIFHDKGVEYEQKEIGYINKNINEN